MTHAQLTKSLPLLSLVGPLASSLSQEVMDWTGMQQRLHYLFIAADDSFTKRVEARGQETARRKISQLLHVNKMMASLSLGESLYHFLPALQRKLK